MHGLCPGFLCDADELIAKKIALRGRRRAKAIRLVGHLDMQRPGIGVGIDRNRLDPHLARGLDDAAGDFAAIGDQYFLEHQAASPRSEEHTSELQSLMRITYAVFCLKKKKLTYTTIISLQKTH